ncbi:MAG: stage III sporulation protein AE [Clostridia bacterium]|nr:stage III sporulation protein AE [Clostridia bacterium]
MKKILLILLVLCLLCANTTALATTEEQLNEQVENTMENLDYSDLEQIGDEHLGNFSQLVEEILNGDFGNVGSFASFLLDLFCKEILAILPQALALLVVVVVCGLLKKGNGFVSSETDKVVQFVGLAVVATTLVGLVVSCYQSVQQMLGNLQVLCDASSPVILALVVANGGNSLSSVCQPSMVFLSSTIVTFCSQLLLPISLAGMVLIFAGNISSNVKIGKLQKFVNDSLGWVLGVVFMVFSAFSTVSGISASVVDGVSYRTAKFATKNYIPILGGYISDGLDVVVASASLVKNSLGLATLVVLVAMMVKPLLHIGCLNFALQGVSALAESLGNDSFGKVLGDVGKVLNFWIALVCAVCFMFAIVVTIAICSANGV